MNTDPETKPFADELAKFIKDHPASPLSELDRVMERELEKELK